MTLLRRKLIMSRVVERYALTADLSIERYGGGSWADGRWVNEQPTAVALTAHVQPMGQEAKQILPEGDRTRDGITVWSTTAIRPVQRSEGKPGDVVLWGGKSYEVVALTDWSSQGDYWEAGCIKVDQ